MNLKNTLKALPAEQQQELGTLIIEHVLELSDDSRVKSAIAAIKRDNPSKNESVVLRALVKKAALDSHARCGSDSEWSEQAAHFVALAASSLLAGDKESGTAIWQAAMSCRMARTCKQIDTEQESDKDEAIAQYRILNSFLKEQIDEGTGNE